MFQDGYNYISSSHTLGHQAFEFGSGTTCGILVDNSTTVYITYVDVKKVANGTDATLGPKLNYVLNEGAICVVSVPFASNLS